MTSPDKFSPQDLIDGAYGKFQAEVDRYLDKLNDPKYADFSDEEKQAAAHDRALDLAWNYYFCLLGHYLPSETALGKNKLAAAWKS